MSRHTHGILREGHMECGADATPSGIDTIPVLQKLGASTMVTWIEMGLLYIC